MWRPERKGRLKDTLRRAINREYTTVGIRNTKINFLLKIKKITAICIEWLRMKDLTSALFTAYGPGETNIITDCLFYIVI